MEGWALHEGPILEKGVTPMRSFVVGRCSGGGSISAGDAASSTHRREELNLAVRDVQVLAGALAAWYRDGDAAQLDAYSETCLRASGARSTSPGG